MDNILVVGTDTGVGKTVLSLLLMQFFQKRGCNPFYLKPLQTGARMPTTGERCGVRLPAHGVAQG